MNPNEFLATEVMGWEIRVIKEVRYFFFKNIPIMLVSEWSPKIDIIQAFEVVEKMGLKGFSFELCKNIKGEYLAMFSTDMADYTYSHKNPATAITLAAVKALGGDTERK